MKVMLMKKSKMRYYSTLILDTNSAHKIDDLLLGQKLVIFQSRHDAIVDILNWAMDKSRLLDTVSWIVVDMKNQLLTPISPAMRLFNVVSKSDVKEMDLATGVKYGISYIYTDIIRNKTLFSYIGYFTKSLFLRTNKEFADCCYNTSGYKMRSVYIKEPLRFESYIKHDGNIEYTGIFSDIYDEIVDILGLRGHLYEVPDKKYGDYIPESKTAYGLFGELFSNKADIALGQLTDTSRRRFAATFSVEIARSFTTVVYPIHSEYDYLYFYIKPFTPKTWLLISISCAFVLLIGTLFRRLSNSNSGGVDVIHLWGALMRQGSNVEVRFCSYRMYRLLILLTAELLTVFYGSKIISMAAVKFETPPFASILELAEQDTYVPVFVDGASQLQDIMESDYHEIVALRRKMLPDFDKHMLKIVDEFERRYHKEKLAFFCSTEYAGYLLKKHKILQMMEDTFMPSGIHLAWRKDFPLGRIINRLLLKMKENGTLKRLFNRYYSEKKDSSDTSDVKQININIFYVLLIILVSGIFIAAVLNLIDCIYHKKRRRSI